MSLLVTPDFTVQNHGTIFILNAETEEAQDWVRDNLPDDALTWGRNGIVVEHRFIGDIVGGIRNSGLSVE